MLHRFVVAIGAGCAAALLFAVSAQSSLLAMTLAYLAPLPIMIATLGWGLDGGAIAAAIAIAVLAVVAEPLSALVFAGSVAVPAWALAAFSVSPLARYFKRLKPDAPVHAPLGAIVSFAALLGMLGGLAVLTTVIVIYGGYREAARHVAEAITTLAGDAFDGAPGYLTAREFGDPPVRSGPPAIAASTLMMLCVNLYARLVPPNCQRNLPRPWPDIPSRLRFLGQWASHSSLVSEAPTLPLRPRISPSASAGLARRLALQGLAVAHAIARSQDAAPHADCALRLLHSASQIHPSRSCRPRHHRWIPQAARARPLSPPSPTGPNRR
jgi:hypothetical protein